jgi:hypothetical protein
VVDSIVRPPKPPFKDLGQRYTRKCNWRSQPSTKGQTCSATGQSSAANGTDAKALTGGGSVHRSTCTNAVAALSRQPLRAESGVMTDRVYAARDGRLPLRRRFGSEGPQRGPGDEMSLKIERVVDGGMDAEEALGGSS